jgi:Zn-dependent peptidase ImmA (M78 family)
MPERIEVEPALIVWARSRSRLAVDDLARRFPKLSEWEAGDSSPTLRQLESFARSTHTPVGYLFLQQPPDEPVPIPDFRVMGNTEVDRPSPDLLDTIYQCEQRQEWYRDFATLTREDRVNLVGSLSVATPIVEAATSMRATLQFEVEERGANWGQAFRLLVDHAEDLGILVMVNGVVGSNTHRKLDPREFRGFALVDALAPVVFVNGADTKAGQIFTLAHELAHLWLGATGVSNSDLRSMPTESAERWCNQVAAEVLVPFSSFSSDFRETEPLTGELERLARRFKVSTLVILRRVHDAGHLTRDAYHDAYEAELDRVMQFITDSESSGGNFYNTQPARVSKRFARALITSTLEGQTLYSDAFQMLGFRRLSTFTELSTRLGVV